MLIGLVRQGYVPWRGIKLGARLVRQVTSIKITDLLQYYASLHTTSDIVAQSI